MHITDTMHAVDGDMYVCVICDLFHFDSDAFFFLAVMSALKAHHNKNNIP